MTRFQKGAIVGAALAFIFVLTEALAVAKLGKPQQASHAQVAPHLFGMGLRLPTHTIHPKKISAAGGGALPAVVDLTQWAGPPASQGSVNACAQYSTQYTLGGWQENRATGHWIAFSPMYSYTQLDHGQNSGTSIEGGLEIAMSQGRVPVDQYSHPGDGAYHDFRDQPNAHDTQVAASHTIPNYDILFEYTDLAGRPTNGAAIRAALAAGHPVVVGFRVTENFMLWNGSGAIDAGGNTTYGYHATVLFGYHATASSYVYRGENSWGRQWGDGGWFNVTEAFINQETFTADIAYAPKTTRPIDTPTAGATAIPSSVPWPSSTPYPTPTNIPTLPPLPTATPTPTITALPTPTATVTRKAHPTPTHVARKHKRHCRRRDRHLVHGHCVVKRWRRG